MITGLVIVMMMMIECFNVRSQGRFADFMRRRGPLQVIIAALLGTVPGCMGGFAVVSLYTHGIMSFGALVAMMIASSGDESFVMLAMMPRTACCLMLGLTVLAIAAGTTVDLIHRKPAIANQCEENYAVHTQDITRGSRHFGWKRILLAFGILFFLTALCLGIFEEEHSTAGIAQPEYFLGSINLLSEDWMNIMFAVFGLLVLILVLSADDHFLEEHLWHHVVCHHLLKIFLWTAGTLTIIALLMHFVNISTWVNENVMIMILLAAAVGIIPQSGPHLMFVTMFASGIIPLPVLAASCISQDGHAALPLLAEDRKSFIIAKAVNFVIAVIAGISLTIF